MRDWIARLKRSHELWLLCVIIVLCAGLTLANDYFFTLRNLQDLLTSNAFTGILAAGLLVVLISGGIDISFTATASVAQYAAMYVAVNYFGNWLSVFVIACAVGVLCGAVNALFIQKLRIPSIIVTIATLNIFFGLLIFVTKGKYIPVLPDWFSRGVDFFEFTDANQIG